MEKIIRCRYCNGELELNSKKQYTNILGDSYCSSAPHENDKQDHVPIK